MNRLFSFIKKRADISIRNFCYLIFVLVFVAANWLNLKFYQELPIQILIPITIFLGVVMIICAWISTGRNGNKRLSSIIIRRSLSDEKLKTSEYNKYERQKYISKAKSADTFLDSVFYLNYYNKYRQHWGIRPKPEDIIPQDVFSDYDEQDYSNALRKCNGLLHKSGDVGAAFFNYNNSDSYENAVQLMKNEYSGFCEDVYEIVCMHGKVAMK